MRIQNTNVNFQAGLTAGMRAEMRAVDVGKVTSEFVKRGVACDFKGNQVVAWCSLKTLQIIEDLNKRFGLNWGLPNGVFVEDFKLFETKNKGSFGFTNTLPRQVYPEKDTIIPEKTIFFNEFARYNYQNGNRIWDNIDNIIDENFETNISPTNFFLDIFLHEFFHVAHEENIIKKRGLKNFERSLDNAYESHNLAKFQKKNQWLLGSICEYATTNPFEAIACDLTKRTVNNMDKNTLSIKNDYIKNSPYEEGTFLTPFSHLVFGRKKYWLMRNIWNGKF